MKLYRLLEEGQARELAKMTGKLTWKSGAARTRKLTGTVKQNEEILDHISLQTVGKRILAHPEIQLDAIPLKIHPPKYNRYRDGQHYKIHTDAPWMGETRTDLSCTLWLNDDYEGGVLRIDGTNVKGKPGECLIYECGRQHEVTPVTSGERICIVTWLQSRLRDPAKRKIVTDFRRFLAKMEDSPLFVEGGQIHSALLRRWME